MAGRGPAPGSGAKHPSQRRRRNLPPELDQLPEEGFQGDFPALPDGYDYDTDQGVLEIEFRAETREWYETWGRSPMAVKFTGTDWNRLRWVVAPLFDRYMRSPGDTKLASELRLQEERFGGTVMDRARLKQTIGPSENVQERQQVAEVRRLRAVDAA